jgi:hypothetical protein
MRNKWKNISLVSVGVVTGFFSVASPSAAADNSGSAAASATNNGNVAPVNGDNAGRNDSKDAVSGEKNSLSKTFGSSNASGDSLTNNKGDNALSKGSTATIAPNTNPSLTTGNLLQLDRPLDGLTTDHLKEIMDEAEKQSEKSYTRQVDRDNLDNNRAIRMQIEPYLLNPGRADDAAAYLKLANQTLALLKTPEDSDKVYEALLLLDKMAAYDFDRGQSRLLAERIAQNRTWDKEYAQLAQFRVATLPNNVRLNEIRVMALGEFQAQILQLLGRRQFLQAQIAIRAYKASFKQEAAYIVDTKAGKATNDAAASAAFDQSDLGLFNVADALRTEILDNFNMGVSQAGTTFKQGAAMTIDALETYCQEGLVRTQEHYDAMVAVYDQHRLTTSLERLQELLILNDTAPQLIAFETEKRQVLLDTFKETNKVPDLLHLKDYDGVESALDKIDTLTNDYDDAQIRAAAKTAKAASNNAFEAARLAMSQKNSDRADTYLHQAMDIWPANPRIGTFLGEAAGSGEELGQARILFDQAYDRQDWRAIYEKRAELSVALQNDSDRADKLKEVVERMGKVDMLVAQAQDYLQRNAPYVAWELTEEAAKIADKDQVVSSAQAQVAPHVGQYIEFLNKAQTAAKAGQPAASLIYYLQAQKLYPGSRAAQDGIQEDSQKILDHPA